MKKLIEQFLSRYKGKPVKLAGVIFIGLAILSFPVGMVHYSESPQFCNSCHIMEPYYKAWKSSKHNFVACVECHYPPGSPRTLLWKKFQALSQVAKYVTRTYSSKPFADVDDQSCLRSGCHSTRLLEGRIITEKGIRFDHRPHLTEVRRGRQLKCVSCHSQMVIGKHIEVTYDTCYLCHFKGKGEGRNLNPIGGCLGCHELPKKTFKLGNMSYNHKDFVTKQGLSCQNCHFDVMRGKGDAPQDRCFTCHNQPEKLARYTDIPFIHENHVTKHNVACFHCHQEMRHGLATGESQKIQGFNEPVPVEGSMSSETIKAHQPTLAFDCSFCHENKHMGQLEMYTGKVAPLGLKEMPSPMYTAEVDCVACHYSEHKDGKSYQWSGRTYQASHDACVKCHGPKFKGIWEDTKSELTITMKELNAKMAMAQEAINASSVPSKTKWLKQLNQARQWLDFVEASHGEHNIYLASEILRQADRALNVLAQEMKTTWTDLSSKGLISGNYCATMCHEKVGVKVPPETVKAFGSTMPHLMHTQMMGCVECHEIGAHKKVPLKKNVRDTCKNCHP